MKGVSICSGIGGLDFAAEYAGISTIGQVEYDDACIRALEKHWPHTPRRRDVREFNGDEFGDFDILYGGIPCQPFSIAGKRLAEADPRNLWPDTYRIIRHMQPRWVVIENVANFARLALDTVWADLEAEGYSVGACVLPACAFGATHRRERCFTLAYTGSFHAQPDGRPDIVADSCGDAEGKAQQRQWRGHASACGCETGATLAYSDSGGKLQPQGRIKDERGWPNYGSEIGGTLAHSDGKRLEERLSAGLTGAAALHGPFHAVQQRPSRLHQSDLGRAVDGISRRLDARFPAAPGQAQHQWEAPRVINSLAPGARSRLKQLGNAVVWQQAYPIFALLVAIDEVTHGRSKAAA